jgi:hypothetical protein
MPPAATLPGCALLAQRGGHVKREAVRVGVAFWLLGTSMSLFSKLHNSLKALIAFSAPVVYHAHTGWLNA